MNENYYTVLGVKESAALEEIKNKYKELIKLYHPDKQLQQSSEEFIKVNEAWKVLSNEKLRKEYDSSLLQNDLKEQPLIYAEVNLNEMNFEDDVCNYPCRCGDYFVISRTEIDDDCLIECAECSNSILIRFNKD